jgi:dTDP-4-dehydrorhamnose reductase
MSICDYPAPAPRPANTVLDRAAFAAAFGGPARRWAPALARCLDALFPVAAQARARDTAQGGAR